MLAGVIVCQSSVDENASPPLPGQIDVDLMDSVILLPYTRTLEFYLQVLSFNFNKEYLACIRF